MSRFLSFEQLPSTGKTEIWAVNSKKWGDRLGTIKSLGPLEAIRVLPGGGDGF